MQGALIVDFDSARVAAGVPGFGEGTASDLEKAYKYKNWIHIYVCVNHNLKELFVPQSERKSVNI